ncbi:MAG: ABC transporter ATP-binding protein [Bacillota bacterium]|nr:ABC transporter ATP-binding protein [Bacillota bacterium]
MARLMKYLKRSFFPIVAVLLLLVVEAYCDLALPQYTSDIVNIGIQQGGIKDIAPAEIRVSEMEKLLYFMEEEDQEAVLSHYETTEKTVDGKDLSLYQRKGDDNDTLETLNSLFEVPMLLVNAIENGVDSQNSEGKAEESEDFAIFQEMVPQGAEGDFFTALSQMPQAQREELLSSIHAEGAKLQDTLGSSTLRQMDVAYVQQEYQACGIDTDQLQTNYIWRAGAKMAGFALIIAATTVLISLLASRIGALFARDVRRDLYTKVVGFSHREFQHFSTASLITRCTNDIQQVLMLVIMMLRMVFYAPIIGVGALFKVLNTASGMAWVIGIAVGAILLLVITLLVATMPKFKALQKLVDKVNLITREILTGLPVIRAFSRERHEEQRFDTANVDLTKANLFVNKAMALMMPTMMLIMNGVSVLIIWVGASAIDQGTMQVGSLMAFIQYTMQIIMAFLMLSMMSIMLPRAMVSANRIADVLSTENSVKDPEIPKHFDATIKGTVEFRDVSFRYPGAEADVLKDISFTAQAGETTAIIGSTGSGKSTVAKLIPRFFDVTKGAILVDGIDIRDVTRHDLRDKIGYVPQKANLFSGTIATNIAYSGGQDEDAVRRAAEIAQAKDFIEEKEDRYDSEVAQGGTNVSGGQRQRLSIARAIAKNPEIYIFDDSFSALDYKTDAALRKALRETIENSTVFIIAQRISTVLDADRIVVLDDGEVAGIGTHSELLQTSEVYRQIALSQLSKEELGL